MSINTTSIFSYFHTSIQKSFLEKILFCLIYAWNGIIVILLCFIIWVISYILLWVVGFFLRVLFGRRIKKNERRLDLITLNHEKFVKESPFNLSGWTNNRVLCYQLLISWTICIFGISGILISEPVYALILTPIGSIAIFIAYRPNLMDLPASFLGRFHVLYYDLLRIGETIFLDKVKYEVRNITIFTVLLRRRDYKIDEVEDENKNVYYGKKTYKHSHNPEEFFHNKKPYIQIQNKIFLGNTQNLTLVLDTKMKMKKKQQIKVKIVNTKNVKKKK